MVKKCFLVQHGNERLVIGQRIEGNEDRCLRVGRIIEPGDRDARRLMENTSGPQGRRGLPIDLERDLALHDIANDAARMAMAARALGRLQIDTMRSGPCWAGTPVTRKVPPLGRGTSIRVQRGIGVAPPSRRAPLTVVRTRGT